MSMLFNLSEFCETQAGLVISMSLGVIIYVIINVLLLRECFLYLESRHAYFKVNLIAYLAFALVSLITYLFGGNMAYTWLFSITKFIAYSAQDITSVTSLIVFHFIMLLTIIAAPWDMYLDRYLNRP